ncbi:hypothetical protein [Ornithinimicrobium cryptoxanthini]|uniref:hypothetical protein n=1 Tax=Ornithinimicrobium cryptoxanthini TaxID=2934161 RepID=UPI0021177AE8|nr:hypothetical protein [Ornithinimicrobium cryptoxanthini]
MTDTDWIALGSIAGAVTALATAAMAVAIIITAFYARDTLQATRDDSRARTRPVIVAELRRESLSKGTTLLVLRNLGQSVAANVSVTFHPEPPKDVASLSQDNMWKWIYERYANPVTTWAPGWTANNVIRAGHDDLEAITVKVKYEGPDETKYEDSYDLHPDHVLKHTESNPSKVQDPIKLEQQKVSALQALVRTIRDH